jgi:hypothetical protein
MLGIVDTAFVARAEQALLTIASASLVHARLEHPDSGAGAIIRV